MAERRLLGVFAHPDDESFGTGGTLARYADQGVAVHVCIATDGAAGSFDPEVLEEAGVDTLVELRAKELACASDVLGVEARTLPYRDSGMAGSEDNAHPDSLYQAPLDDVVRDLVRVIREVRPHVVITHDPTGGYRHPDHIKVNQAVEQAFHRSGAVDDGVGDGDGGVDRDGDDDGGKQLAPWQPLRLYWAVIPKRLIRFATLVMRLTLQDPTRFGRNNDIDLTGLGVPDDEVDVKLDISAYAEQKERAGECHYSQTGGMGLVRRLVALVMRPFAHYERFVQAYPEPGERHDDLFAGLDVATRRP